jgi:hypothetical protein
MTYILNSATSAFALAWLVVTSNGALAQLPTQPSTNLRSNNVTFDYIEPRDPKWLPVYDRLKNRQVLEAFSQFLSPLRLPVTYRLKTKQCDEADAFYGGSSLRGTDDNEWSMRYCYELVDDTEKTAPKQTTPEGLTRGEYIVGTFVSTVLHETGHALSDMVKLPVLGREEDSADQISGFFMLQFGSELARATIKGTYYNWMQDARLDPNLYWDVHSTNRQRAQNYLCMGFGGQPETFKDLVEKGLLPKARAGNCAREYQEAKHAFTQTILPFIDQDLMRQVQSKQWFKPHEFD